MENKNNTEFMVFDLHEMDNTIVAEIISLMLSDIDFQFEGPKVMKEGSEIIGELNRYEKVCHVLWQKYDHLSAILMLSLHAAKKELNEINDEEVAMGFSNRSETVRHMLFESIFRRFIPERKKFFYVGCNFKILKAEIGEGEEFAWDDFYFYDDEEEDIPNGNKLFSLIDLEQVGNA